MTWIKQVVVNSGGGTSNINVTTAQSSTFNLFDKSQIANPAPSPVNTSLIPVIAGRNYSWGTTTNCTYTIYDSSQNVLTTATSLGVRIPLGGAYLSVKIYGGQSVVDTFMIVEGSYQYLPTEYIPYQQQTIVTPLSQGLYKSDWYNKRWWVLGDSISTGNGAGAGSANVYATKPYHYNLAHQRFIKVSNFAVSGYTIGNIYNNIVANLPTTASPDLITLMAGTNDHGFNIAMGTINDTPATSGSFYAVYRKTIEYIKAQYPFATIGLITPIERYNSGGTDGKVANAAGFTLRQYCDAVIAMANYYQLPYIDLYNNLGFTPYNTNDYINFFCPDGGTHPNDKGHERMARRIGSFIEKI